MIREIWPDKCQIAVFRGLSGFARSLMVAFRKGIGLRIRGVSLKMKRGAFFPDRPRGRRRVGGVSVFGV